MESYEELKQIEKEEAGNQICIQDLADYNEGTLRFEWLDLNDFADVEALQEHIENFLAERGHEEYMIADYGAFPDMGEYPNIEKVWEVWEAIQEHGLNAITGFIENFNIEDLEHFEDSYNGEWECWQDFVYEMVDSCGYLSQMPVNIQSYFDYEAFGNDLRFDYCEYHANGHTYVYSNNW